MFSESEMAQKRTFLEIIIIAKKHLNYILHKKQLMITILIKENVYRANHGQLACDDTVTVLHIAILSYL